MDQTEQQSEVPLEAQPEEFQSLRGARPGTDANVFIQITVGILGTVLVALAVIPLKGTKADYLYGIINDRGPVQYLELLMSFMVGSLIALKSRIVNRNLRVVASNPLPPELDLNDDAALQAFRDSLPQRPEFEWSILLNRLDRALALWLGSKDVSRLATYLQSESARDQAASDSSYSLARALMWAIPILGFIGTVNGLGQAVAGFGVLGGAADVGAIKEAIGKVTLGLGVAFDTTLLALILTTLLMFPLTAFQRREENLFGEIDNYLEDVLLARLPSPEQKPIVIENLEDSIEAAFRRYIPDPDRYDEVFTRSIDRAAAAVEERFAGLSAKYETALRDMGQRLADQLSGAGTAVEQSLRGLADEIRKQDDRTLEARRLLGEQEATRFREVAADINATAERIARSYREGAESLQSSARAVSEQMATASRDLAEKMTEVSRLAANIDGLLKVSQSIDQTLATLSASEAFKATLEDLRKQLQATTELCNRLSRPRIITLREE
ncbi:MAG: MotA/TolQ/ExbB proton channel family protein [Kiritimatiellae bacterium]|nr:MotA/TolQ/ExbB proton channel family protein [Kiritimatiellia bacterium]MDW8458948.1 MotA/TolQ/ExbB proton channel family protein [Verrucomicrobiota bacterium]